MVKQSDERDATRMLVSRFVCTVAYPYLLISVSDSGMMVLHSSCRLRRSTSPSIRGARRTIESADISHVRKARSIGHTRTASRPSRPVDLLRRSHFRR